MTTTTKAPAIYTAVKERAVLRVAAHNHFCWSWLQRCAPPGDSFTDGHVDDKPRCVRVIGVGERHLVSTIYPGHDSGYADDRVLRVGDGWVRAEPRPITSRFCLPCAARWTNLRPALRLLLPDYLEHVAKAA